MNTKQRFFIANKKTGDTREVEVLLGGCYTLYCDEDVDWHTTYNLSQQELEGEKKITDIAIRAMERVERERDNAMKRMFIRSEENIQLRKALKKIIPYAESYDPAEYGGEEPTQEADIKFARDVLEERYS